MFSYLFTQLGRSLGVFLRTIRAFMARQLMRVTSRLRRLANISRSATKVASSTMQGAMSATQKPTRREDYLETDRLFISKAFLIRVALGLVVLGLLVYFLVWPFILSHFLTARFFKEDRRVPDWSGRVIVYSDEKKKVPLYSGRLEDGVLQGEGKFYDDEGLLSYEGQFLDGVQNGNGLLYDKGVLVYSGQFSNGLFSGRGTLYEDGQPVYEGQFEEGVRSGLGKAFQNGLVVYEGQYAQDLYDGNGKLYENGVLRYDGGFRAGQKEGEGIAYFASGIVSYQGRFAGGQPEGSGTAYETDGRKRYTGGFSAGVYSGAGVAYPAPGQQLEAEFKEGEPEGIVQWKKGGVLYYRGEWTDDQPAGYGTLLNKAGKVIYDGAFFGGTIDGAKLVGIPTDDLRTALGEGTIRGSDSGGGFLIVAPELGLTALCSYQTEEEPSKVYAVYLTRPEGDDEWVRLLPGMDNVSAAQWPADQKPMTGEANGGPRDAGLPAGSYRSETSALDGCFVRVLYSNSGEKAAEAAFIGWSGNEAAPAALDLDKMTANDADDRMEGFLAALDMMDGVGGATTSAPAKSGSDPETALESCKSAADATKLAVAMIDYLEQTEREAALNENLERVKALLTDAEKKYAEGTGSQDAVEALKREQTELAEEIEACKAAEKRAEISAQAVGASELASYALSDMLVSFEPSTENIDELSLIAIAYAQVEEKGDSATAIEERVKTALVDLTEARRRADSALRRYRLAEEDSQAAAGAYATGGGTKETWYRAMSTQALARAELTAALADFSRQANEFNLLTGGWVSRTYGYHNGVFEPLFKQTEEKPAENAGAQEPSTASGGTETPENTGTSGGAETPENAGTSGGAETPENTGTSGGAETPENTGAPGNAQKPEDDEGPELPPGRG